jgi:hypothetical protein
MEDNSGEQGANTIAIVLHIMHRNPPSQHDGFTVPHIRSCESCRYRSRCAWIR